MFGLLFLLFLFAPLLFLPMMGGQRQVQPSRRQVEQQQQLSFDDAYADAKRWTDRLGSQVLNLSGNDAASKQAMADASERFNAASAGLSGNEGRRPTLRVNRVITKKGPADAGPFRVPAWRRDQSWVWVWVSAAEAVPEALQAWPSSLSNQNGLRSAPPTSFMWLSNRRPLIMV